jgi:ABC-type glutathione transport system ATPase component
MTILAVERLSVSYQVRNRSIVALHPLDMALAAGEIVAIIGASGSGKSSLARALLGILPHNARMDGLWRVCPQRSAFVQQEARASLHPLLRVERQLHDVLRAQGVSRATTRREIAALLDSVGIGSEVARRYPHTLSGGEAQRIALARALASRPALLVADEPTSALDVVVQAEIMRLIVALARQHSLAVLLITHDLALVAEMADRVVVLCDGVAVETGSVGHIFTVPQHPATRQLLGSGAAPAPPAEPAEVVACSPLIM